MINTSNLIAGAYSAKGINNLRAINPANQEKLEGTFTIATKEEIDAACFEANKAWKIYKNTSGLEKAKFLRMIADEIEALGDVLIQRVIEESGLP